ncbi:MAG: hypothetical protein GY700_03645 [Propionibacteriaceae bacterium]|nr:hypothetical protein [Propionibacteriaceae bacterium]
MTDQWEFVITAVVVPFVVGFLRKWKVAEQWKALVALVVAVALSAVTTVLDGDATWSELPLHTAAVFGGATVIYRLFKWTQPEVEP